MSPASHSEAWEAWQADVHRRDEAEKEHMSSERNVVPPGSLYWDYSGDRWLTADEHGRWVDTPDAGSEPEANTMHHDLQLAAFIATCAFLITLMALYLRYG